jgi:CMP-N,N'-diacetyllegionaminic acid synthase
MLINKKKLTAIIPARIGSKEIIHKNIKKFYGKPLIYWTIFAALSSKYIDDVIVNTDSELIASLSSSYGAKVPYLRSKELSGDNSYSVDVIKNMIYKSNLDGWIIMLQATSPLRNYIHIDEMCSLLKNKNYKSIVSVKNTREIPSWQYSIKNSYLVSLLNKQSLLRQEENKYYTLNGAQYLASTKQITKEGFINSETAAYFMSEKNSIDIDNKFDWEIAEFLMSKSVIPVSMNASSI